MYYVYVRKTNTKLTPWSCDFDLGDRMVPHIRSHCLKLFRFRKHASTGQPMRSL